MELHLEIEPGSDPICGVLFVGDPIEPHPFTGWMQLAELIASASGPHATVEGEADPSA